MAPPLALLLLAALVLARVVSHAHGGGGFYDPARVSQLSWRPSDRRELTSSGTFLAKHEDEIVSAIEKHVAAWTFPPDENTESIQILCYEIGQKYDAHFDYFHDKNNVKHGGQRIATVLIYLTDVKKSGEALFPNAEEQEVSL